jgi:hypothetical protein
VAGADIAGTEKRSKQVGNGLEHLIASSVVSGCSESRKMILG